MIAHALILPVKEFERCMAGLGRLDSVTNDRFQESEFNCSFPAMSLKSERSPSDPEPSVTGIAWFSRNRSFRNYLGSQSYLGEAPKSLP